MFFEHRDKLPLKQVSLIVTGTNWTTTRAVGVPYKTMGGAYRVRINLVGTTSVGTTTLDLTIQGLTFKGPSGYTQAVAFSSGNVTLTGLVKSGGGSILNLITGAPQTTFRVSADLELDSKPSFIEV